MGRAYRKNQLLTSFKLPLIIVKAEGRVFYLPLIQTATAKSGGMKQTTGERNGRS